MFELQGDTAGYVRFIEHWRSDDEYMAARTSGSTGAPKEIRLPKADMRESARATIEFFGLHSSSTLVCPLSVNYIAGKMMAVRAVEADCRLVCPMPSNSDYLSGLDNTKIDLLAVVPTQVEALIERLDSIEVKNVIIGGAPLPTDLERELVRRRVRAFATYGMTETSSHVALRRLGHSDYVALNGIWFDTDSAGRLIIHSSTRSFGTLVTNDMVELLSARSFVWKGRSDNVINSGGIKLCPEEIEKRIDHLMPGPFYVVGEFHAKWGSRPVLVIEGQPDPEADRVLMERMAAILTKVELPQRIVRVDEMSLTPSGKIIRKLH